MTKGFIIAALVFALALASSCDGQGKGGISGTAAVKGASAEGAEVNVYDVPEKSSRPPVATVYAGKDGRFNTPLKPGTYYVAVKLNSPSGGPPFLSKVPPDPVVVGTGMVDLGEMALNQEYGKDKPPPGAGVKGIVVKDGTPVTGAVVYLYQSTDSGLKGPSYYASERTGEDGSFSVDAAPGRYYVTVRKRLAESSAGELLPGDLSGVCKGNPLGVSPGVYTDAGTVALAVIDPSKLKGVRIGVKEAAGVAYISGRVTAEDAKPLAGVYVFAYDDYRMMGKPMLISDKTGPDGRYRLVLNRAGRYYIGARDSLGGPMEPGDVVGVYGGSKDNSVTVTKGKTVDNVDISLKEVQ